MNRKLLLAVTLTCLILSIAYFTLKHDPADKFIKTRLITFTRDKIGRELTIAGRINLALLPEGVITTQKLILNNVGNDQRPPLFSLKNSRIAIDSRALINKQVKVNQFSVDGLTINLLTDKQGAANWSDLMMLSPENSKIVLQKIDSPPPSSLNFVAIKQLLIENASILWQNQLTGSQIELKNLSVRAENLAFDQPAPVEISAEISGPSVNPSGKLKWQAIAQLDKHRERLSLTQNHLEASGFIPNIASERLTTIKAPEIIVNLKQQRLEIPELDLAQAEIKLHASAVRVDNFSNKPSLQATVNLDEFNPTTTAKIWAINMPRVSDSKALQRLALQFHLQLEGDSVVVHDLDGHLDDTRFAGNTTIKNWLKPELTFELSADTIRLDRYLPAQQQKPAKAKSRSQGLTISIPRPPDKTVLALPANGQLRVDSLVSNGITFKNARLAIASDKKSPP